MASTAMLLLILSAQHISALKPLHDSITFECTNRYELRHSLQDLVPQMKNCTLVRQVYPACAKDIVVAYSENSPYSVHSNGHVHGLIPGNIILLLWCFYYLGILTYCRQPCFMKRDKSYFKLYFL